MIQIINIKDDFKFKEILKGYMKNFKEDFISLFIDNSNLDLIVKNYDLISFFKVTKIEIFNTIIDNTHFQKIIQINTLNELIIISSYFKSLEFNSNTNLIKIKIINCEKVSIQLNDNFNYKFKKLILKGNKFLDLNKILKSNYIKNNWEELDVRNSNLNEVNKIINLTKLNVFKADKNNFINIPLKCIILNKFKIDKNTIFFNNIENELNNIDPLKFNTWISSSINNYSKLFYWFLKDLNSISYEQISIYYTKYIKNYFLIIYNFNMILLIPDLINDIKKSNNFLFFYIIAKYKYLLTFESSLINILDQIILENKNSKEYNLFLNSFFNTNKFFKDIFIKKDYLNFNYNIMLFIKNEYKGLDSYIKNIKYDKFKKNDFEYFGPAISNNKKEGFYLLKNLKNNFLEIILFNNDISVFTFKVIETFKIDENYNKIEKIWVFNCINKIFGKFIKDLVVKYSINYYMLYNEENLIIKYYEYNQLMSTKLFNGFQKRYNIVFSSLFNKIIYKKTNSNILWDGNVILDKKIGSGILINKDMISQKQYINDKETKIKRLLSIMEESEEEISCNSSNIYNNDIMNISKKSFFNDLIKKNNIKTVTELKESLKSNKSLNIIFKKSGSIESIN